MSEFSKLQWHCRRGMKELDILLTRYLQQQYNDAPSSEQHNFQKLLECSDPDLYAYFIGQKIPLDDNLSTLVEKIRKSP